MRNFFASRVSRPFQVVAGVIVFAAALLALVFGASAVYVTTTRADQRVGASIIAVVFLTLGILSLDYALRLLLGLRRRDGGLVSPAVLRCAGVYFAVFPFVLLVFDGWHWVVFLLHLASSGACFALASRRASPATEDPSVEPLRPA